MASPLRKSLMFRNTSPNRQDGVQIEAHRSDTRMSDIVQVVNAEGQVFRLYHPQTWKYLSVNWWVAEKICRGLAEYYQDEPNEEQEPTSEEDEKASSHRVYALDDLAREKFPVPEVFNIKVNDRPRLPKEWNDKLNAMMSSNPFYLLWVEREYFRAQGTRIFDDPGHFAWRCVTLDLFKQLVLAENVQRCPDTLCHIEDDDSSLLPGDVTHQRGRLLASQDKLAKRHPRSRQRPVQWGPLYYDEATANLSHFCVSGMTRSGKTTLLKLLFQSLHANATPQPRFVLYDAKPDLLPCLFPPGSEPSDDQVADVVCVLSPFDSRGTAWDIAADAAKESTAAEIAELLFPSSSGSNEGEFYGPAVRDVTTELMVALTRMAAQKWTFYDLLCAMQLDNLQPVLCSTPNGRQLYATYFEGTKSNVPEDLPKSLRTKSASLLRAAYAWSHAERRIGLRQWVRSQTKTIVLFNDEENFKANKEINRVLLNLLAQTLLAVKNPPTRTYLYLDEVEHLGFIDPMTRLIEKGAGLQVNLAIAFHDLLTLKKVYGEATEGILGQASFQAFLKVNSQVTSEWASYQIGSPEVKVTLTTTQSGTTETSDGDATSESRQTGESQLDNYASRRLVLPDEIRDLPFPAQANELRGYFVAPNHPPYLGTLPAAKVIRSKADYLAAEKTEKNFYALWPKVEGVSDHCPQPDERYELPDDTFITLHRLGFTKRGYGPTEPATPRATGQPTPDQPPAAEDIIQPPPPDASPSDSEQRKPPPEERDYNMDFDIKFPDD